MKSKMLLSLIAAGSLVFSSAGVAASAKTYQVTGAIMEVNDSMIVVMKGKERFEINRDSSAKVTGELKVGEKVMIEYTMTAKDIQVKADKGAKSGSASPSPSASAKK